MPTRFLSRCLVCLVVLIVLLPYSAAAKKHAVSTDTLIGSMLMLGFRGATLTNDDPFLRLLAQGKIGHCILFDRDTELKTSRNIVVADQTAALIAKLRKARGHPMLIGVDQEGGFVCRLKSKVGFSVLPSPAKMGNMSLEETRLLATHTGNDMRRLGFSIDFAPVVDVASGKASVVARFERSFGKNAQEVAAHAEAFGQGLLDAGILPTLKHFPGIGCATDDSHIRSMDISACFDEKRDLLPYTMAIAKGWKGAIMVGHALTSFDPHVPASLSKAVITDLLRERLGWQGVVITDDLRMHAILDYYSLEDTIRMAIEAGADILLFGNNLNWRPDMAEQAYLTLRKLVDNGTISRARLEASYARVQALLAQLPKLPRK